MPQRNASDEFCERVDRLEERFKGKQYKYVDSYLMPRELMKALREHLRPKPKKKNEPASMPLFDKKLRKKAK